MKPCSGVLPSKCLFIREKQTLMGGPKVCCTYDWVLGCEPGNIHEPKGLIYPMSQFTVPVPLFTMRHEIKIPLVNPLHGSITTCGKRPQEVQSSHRLTVSSNHPLWIGDSGCHIECIAVHIVTSVTRKLHSILLLKWI
ncbi:hypothetical protein V8G54_033383 [Vigna mungo]|uniref:Uncharacterized protein n=1 Tax=Vigna mungo TaxID=3915 RepID=A0AAQ3MNS0_VIGMU